MESKRVGAIVAAIAVASLQSGCSFLFVKGPPANHAELASVECSDSNGWPIVDAIWAGLNGLGAATAPADKIDSSGMKSSPSHDQVVAVGVSWLVVSGISAIYGFSKVSACRDAKQLHEHNVAGGPPPALSCREERARAMAEAHREKDQIRRMRMIDAAPVCDALPAPVVAPAPAPAPTPPPAAAPAPAPAPAPLPATSFVPTRHSLAMRPTH